MYKAHMQRKGISRLWHAFLYSLSGLKYAFKGEIAFRQELILFSILTLIILFLPLSILHKIFLLFCNSMLLIIELVNSSIEAVVDCVSPEYNEFAKKAKDMASSAVLITLLSVSIVWIITLLSVFDINLL